MKHQHTPGPWITDDRHVHPAVGLTYPTGIEPETDVIVLVDTDCHENGLLNETDKANLRLIAAAPELLRALKDLAKEVMDSRKRKWNVRKDFSLMNAHACACKAIWKAEGQTENEAEEQSHASDCASRHTFGECTCGKAEAGHK